MFISAKITTHGHKNNQMHRNIYQYLENKVDTRIYQGNFIWNSKIRNTNACPNKPTIYTKPEWARYCWQYLFIFFLQVCISFSARLMTIADFGTSTYLLCAWEKCSRRVKRRSTGGDAGGGERRRRRRRSRFSPLWSPQQQQQAAASGSSSNGNSLGSRAGPPCSAGTATT